jgi:hypothetical protein
MGDVLIIVIDHLGERIGRISDKSLVAYLAHRGVTYRFENIPASLIDSTWTSIELWRRRRTMGRDWHFDIWTPTSAKANAMEEWVR